MCGLPSAQAQDPAALVRLTELAEPPRQELLRRLNLAPRGTAVLVRMREQLLEALDHRDDLPAHLAAVAAMLVVLYHAFELWGLRVDPAAPGVKWINGASGVDIFFAISGFLVGCTVRQPCSLTPKYPPDQFSTP